MPPLLAQLPFLLLLFLLLLTECAPRGATDASFVLVDRSVELESIDPGCAETEFRFGLWEARSLTRKNKRKKEFRCRQFEYANATCGPPFSQPTFCAAAACRSILFVGDSLILSNYRELVDNAVAARDANLSDVPTDIERWHAAAEVERHKYMHDQQGSSKKKARFDPGCSPSGLRQSFSMCRSSSCPGGIRVSFGRHDFLTNLPGHRLYGRDDASRCEGWHSRSTLAEYQVVVLGMGAHLAEFGPQITNATFHRVRARRVAQLIHENAPPSLAVVYAKSHWGIEKFQMRSAREPHRAGLPSDAEPPPPNGTLAVKYSWDRIDWLNNINADAIRRGLSEPLLLHQHGQRQGLGRAVAVIDPTRALARRFDCRADYLHFFVPGAMTHSWLRMLQSALQLLRR